MKILHNSSQIKTKTVFFFDLDGTLINPSSGKTFPEDATDFKIRKECLDVLRNHEKVRHIFIVSNQAGLNQYGTSTEEFDAKFESIIEFIKRYVNIGRDSSNKVNCKGFYCTAKGFQSKNRKPNTGMLERCLKYLPLVQKPKINMIMIGDASGIHTEERDDFSDSDLRTAKNFDIDYMDIEDFVKKS